MYNVENTAFIYYNKSKLKQTFFKDFNIINNYSFLTVWKHLLLYHLNDYGKLSLKSNPPIKKGSWFSGLKGEMVQFKGNLIIPATYPSVYVIDFETAILIFEQKLTPDENLISAVKNFWVSRECLLCRQGKCLFNRKYMYDTGFLINKIDRKQQLLTIKLSPKIKKMSEEQINYIFSSPIFQPYKIHITDDHDDLNSEFNSWQTITINIILEKKINLWLKKNKHLIQNISINKAECDKLLDKYLSNS